MLSVRRNLGNTDPVSTNLIVFALAPYGGGDNAVNSQLNTRYYQQTIRFICIRRYPANRMPGDAAFLSDFLF